MLETSYMDIRRLFRTKCSIPDSSVSIWVWCWPGEKVRWEGGGIVLFRKKRHGSSHQPKPERHDDHYLQDRGEKHLSKPLLFRRKSFQGLWVYSRQKGIEHITNSLSKYLSKGDMEFSSNVGNSLSRHAKTLNHKLCVIISIHPFFNYMNHASVIFWKTAPHFQTFLLMLCFWWFLICKHACIMAEFNVYQTILLGFHRLI